MKTPLVLAFLATTAAVRADVKLPTLFGDNMVLQRGVEQPVWGTADPGEVVRVKFAGQEKTATTGPDGRWSVRLAPMKADAAGGTGHFDLAVSGKNSLTLHNIAVGEVWLCSGQSNMEVDMRFVLNSGAEIKSSTNPDLRLFKVGRAAGDAPAQDVTGTWAPASPASVQPFPGTAYYFGKTLQRELKVPVGIVVASWAGSFIESWISPAALQADPDFPAIQGRWQKALDHFPAAMDAYKVELAKYETASADAKAAGKALPKAPFDPLHTPGETDPAKAAMIYDQTVDHYAIPHPSGMFNAMITPLVQFPFAGVAWYQGESNLTRSVQYKRIFPLMIQDWRRAWARPDLPFVYVQLPNIGNRVPGHEPPVIALWPEIREAQQSGLTLPRTGMAVTIDLGNGDIHPQDKASIGGRLANVALGLAYSQPIPYQSPLFDSATVEGNQIRVRLKGDVKGLKTRDGGPIIGFALAGADKKWSWAKADLDGETILVHADSVPQPVAVRYLWDSNPEQNLVTASGLPVAPFRSDTWPVTGTGKK